MLPRDYDTYSVRSYVRQFQRRAVLAAIVLGGLLMALTNDANVFGYVAGAALSIVNFQLMAVDAFQTVGTSPRKARKFVVLRAVVRYTILFGFLAVIYTRTGWNIVAVFIGLFHVQFLLVGGHVIEGLNIRERFLKRS